jgi:DNA-binding response OmpR family regulator
MEPACLLVIEDDYIVARTIERSLRGDEFRIILASRGDRGLQIARQQQPDLVILDIIMPDKDGYTVCREMRSDPSLANIPVLFLTAKIKPQDKIAGFVAGADDYLCKPFNVDELILRVRAILRRTHPEFSAHSEKLPPRHVSSDPQHCLVVGSFMLDTRSFELHTPRRGAVRLTPLQYDLLYHMMTHPGETFSPARLLDEVWDYPAGKGSPDLVRVHIKTLRERVEDNPSAPSFICTVPGRGYTVSWVSSSVSN